MIKVDQLKNSYEGHVFLYCRICHGEYNACARDYFCLPEGHVMTCCEAPLALVRRVTKLVRVKP